MLRNRWVPLLGLLLVAGCGDDTTPMDMEAVDLSVPRDLTMLPDLSEPGDQLVPDDLEEEPDLAQEDMEVDMAEIDLAVPEDLTMVPGDMAMPRDQAMPKDTAMVIDQAMPRDQAVPRDMAMPPADLARDLAVPLDLSVPRDLAIVYDLRGDLSVPPSNLDMLITPTVIPHENWRAFCVSFSACAGGFFGGGVSSCTNRQPQPGVMPFQPLDHLDCVRAAGSDCGRIYACLNLNNPNTTCMPGSLATCGNDIRTTCLNLGGGNGTKLTLDCSEFGLRCVPNVANPQCGFGGCNTPDGGAVTTSCIGGWVSECRSGTQTANEDCRVWDKASCTKTDGGVAACLGSGKACAQAYCFNANIYMACKNGREAAFDCRSLGLGCYTAAADGGAMVAGCRAGNQCDPAVFQETCNGNQLTYCDLGLLRTVDCVGAGWTRCVPRTRTDAGVSSGGYCAR